MPSARAGVLLAATLAFLGASGCAAPTRVLDEPRSDAPASRVGYARGAVFDDRDGDGRRDAGEPGIPGIAVSNGRDVVRTDAAGEYALPVEGDATLFVVKPSGWATPVDANGIPRFYYIHRPHGSPSGLRFPGVEATGPLPEHIDFALRPQPEQRPFRVVVFGDPQPASLDQVDFLAASLLPQLVGVEAAFGISLGDIVHDLLPLYPAINQTIGVLGLPWYNVPGNHDMNFAATSDAAAHETFTRVYGPTTYAFAYAGVHFVVLDDVVFLTPEQRAARSRVYEGGLLPDQLAFIEGLLEGVPSDELVVLLMHIPLVGPDVHQVPQRDALFALLGDRPSFSLAAHTHMQSHHFLGREAGNPGPLHHHVVQGTTCGSWWRGVLQPDGQPFSIMRDGTPQGYSIATFDDSGVGVRYRVAGRPDDYQMRIHAPPWLAREAVDDLVVRVNVFAGSSRSRVEIRVHPDDPWTTLERVEELDPLAVALLGRYEASRAPDEPQLLPPEPSTHLWAGPLPRDPGPGTHVIEVRSTDVFGQVDHGRRLLRIE